MKTANCPSCGAPVNFQSSASAYAVCEFCRSTLLRHGEDLENIGRMADLLEDASLIRIGSEGSFRGVHFGVIGRIQLQHPSGLWNEWHILFDDGRSAWLSEAGGEYVVNAQVAVSEAIPAFESLQPEMAVSLAGRSFTIRTPFGCAPDRAKPSPGLAGRTLRAKGHAAELSLTPADWTQSPLVAAAVEAKVWDAVEGYWIDRPWLSSEACPPGAAPGSRWPTGSAPTAARISTAPARC